MFSVGPNFLKIGLELANGRMSGCLSTFLQMRLDGRMRSSFFQLFINFSPNTFGCNRQVRPKIFGERLKTIFYSSTFLQYFWQYHLIMEKYTQKF
jgi:hypothetical protein